ncbi:MAG: GNAT family N-acetyltransferase [Alphaproteobacteria bacterium]|nr:GNAT family N-acetyltransferase [Alphaproteobacteria bacterium]
MAEPALRDATPADLGVLLTLLRALAAYEKLTHKVRTTEATLRSALFADPPAAYGLLAEQDGAAVGFALWYYTFNSFAAQMGLFVEDVFVVAEKRGQGIGRAIFRELARRAIARGCGQMDWSVLDWNAPAIDFYQRIGARPVRGWTMQHLDGAALAALAA